MCNTRNIESVDQFCKALKHRIPSTNVHIQETYLKGSELNDLVLASSNPKTLYYGILTVCDGNSVSIEMFGGGVFTISETSQDIEVFQDITAMTNANAFFRGYELTLSDV